MEKKAEEKGLLLSYGFHFRASEHVAFLKKPLTTGKMGEIYHAEVKWHRRRGIPGWGCFTNKAIQGGGPLIDIGAHMLDSALYLMDYPEISYVCATYSDRIGKTSKAGLMGSWDPDKFTVEDSLFGFIRFKNGTSLELRPLLQSTRKNEIREASESLALVRGASVFPLEYGGRKTGSSMTGSILLWR